MRDVSEVWENRNLLQDVMHRGDEVEANHSNLRETGGRGGDVRLDRSKFRETGSSGEDVRSDRPTPRFPVIETFGPTVQGEGMVIGQKTMFVRMAGCDYSCSWCDSAFTWDGSGKEQIRMLTAAETLAELRAAAGTAAFSHVTISGGNPALLNNLGVLIDLLHEAGVRIGLETQGSRWQDWFRCIDDLTLSPKPPSSGMSTDWGVLDDIVGKLSEGDESETFSLKIVVFDDADLAYATEVYRRYPSVPIYLQAGNDDVREMDPAKLRVRLLEGYVQLVEKVTASTELTDVRVLPQLHAWLWGNKRGV